MLRIVSSLRPAEVAAEALHVHGTDLLGLCLRVDGQAAVAGADEGLERVDRVVLEVRGTTVTTGSAVALGGPRWRRCCDQNGGADLRGLRADRRVEFNHDKMSPRRIGDPVSGGAIPQLRILAVRPLVPGVGV